MQLNLAQAWGLMVERSHVPTLQGQAVPPAFPCRCCPDMSQVLLGAGVRGWKGEAMGRLTMLGYPLCRRANERTGPGSIGSTDGVVTDHSFLPFGDMSVHFLS